MLDCIYGYLGYTDVVEFREFSYETLLASWVYLALLISGLNIDLLSHGVET